MPKTVAIVGASADRSKYGNKSVRAHAKAGWDVYPVNPKAAEIEGLEAYPDVTSIPVALDRISVYLPAAASRGLLEQWAAKGAAEVFFNPGSDDPAVIDAANDLGLNVVEACSIVDLGLKPSMFPDT
jgi:uncharacterized protein